MKKTIYLDMDDVLCDFTAAYKTAIKANPAIQYPQSQFDYFRKLAPIKDAIASVNYLLQQPLFEVYILTAPSIQNPLCYTEKRLWVEDHFGFEMVKRLIISPHKGLNRGDYLIDDNDSGKGQENFEGQLLKFGSPEFPNWKTVISFFQEKYQL